MKLTALCTGVFLAGGFLCSSITSAHHSFSAEFVDTDGEIHGVVVSGRFANPHPRYQVEVTNADGSKEVWELQGSSVSTLTDGGWQPNFLNPGDEITVKGSLGRNGAKKMFIEGVTKANGDSYPPKDFVRRDPSVVNATP